jgi:hypothetical protein
VFGKKEIILIDTSLTLGEFDPHADGAYRNVKTFPLEVKQGKKVFVSVESDKPVDIALSNSDGICIKFKESVINDKIEVTAAKKETVALVLGIFRGDKADLKLKAWME